MPQPNGSTPFTVPRPPNNRKYTIPPQEHGAPLANYPHARLLAPSTAPAATQTIYISGTSSRRWDGTYDGCTELPTTPPTFKLDCEVQTNAILAKIHDTISKATDINWGLECVVDATVFLTDIERDYAAMNAAWNAKWPDAEEAPARTCVQVAALPGGGRLCVEIKCVAVVPVEEEVSDEEEEVSGEEEEVEEEGERRGGGVTGKRQRLASD